MKHFILTLFVGYFSNTNLFAAEQEVEQEEQKKAEKQKEVDSEKNPTKIGPTEKNTPKTEAPVETKAETKAGTKAGTKVEIKIEDKKEEAQLDINHFLFFTMGASWFHAKAKEGDWLTSGASDFKFGYKINDNILTYFRYLAADAYVKYNNKPYEGVLETMTLGAGYSISIGSLNLAPLAELGFNSKNLKVDESGHRELKNINEKFKFIAFGGILFEFFVGKNFSLGPRFMLSFGDYTSTQVALDLSVHL